MRKLLSKINWDDVLLAHILISFLSFVLATLIAIEYKDITPEVRHIWAAISSLALAWLMLGSFVIVEIDSKLNNFKEK